MRKHIKKFGQAVRRNGRATTPAATLSVSESTNASQSDLKDGYAPPELPAQVGSLSIEPQLVNPPTAQAISTASLAHAAKTHIPSPVRPVTDPLAEPDHEIEVRQPVTNPTKQQNLPRPFDKETTQDSSELLQPRLSCLDQATEMLKEAPGDVYTKLEKINSGRNATQSDPASLLELAVSKMRENKGIPHVIETTIRSILQFKAVVAAAANFDPHRIAPTVWQGFCVVLEACLGESTQLREALIDLDSITSKLSYWANIEALFLGTRRNAILNKLKPLESDLVTLYIEILRLEVEMVKWASDGGIARVFKTPERAVIWRDLVKKISNKHEVCKSTFDRCKMESDQHAKVKKWISEYRPEQAHDDALQRTGVARKYRTCGQWLLDDPRFTSWSSPEPTPNCQILWLRGTAGTGKSTLLARIIQWHLDRASLYPGRRFAYFYCSRGADMNSKHSYTSVLRALLRQAAYDPVKGEISTHVLDAYINAGGDSGDLESFSFTKCETLLHGILESGVKLRIMIDALDECDEPKELLKALRGPSGAIPAGLELLVSSRYEVNVDEKFSNAIRIDLWESVSETDMVTYITTEVNDREEDERILKGKHPDLESRLIAILCRRAGGMFRWVQLQLSFFLKPRPPFRFRRTVEDHLNQLDTSSVAIEKDLNIAYDDIFKRNTGEGTFERNRASKIYKILLCGMQPFSIDAVTEAVNINEQNSPEYEIIDQDCVRLLVQDFIVETERETLEFAHVSVKDYLQGAHQSEYSNAECHAKVAITCLKYISSLERAVYGVTLRSNAFLQYSHEFWGEHCAQLSKEERQSLKVSKELLGWIIEGSGSTTFQDWLHASEEFPRLSVESFTSGSRHSVFIACYWNLVEVVEILLLANPAYNLDLHPDDRHYTLLSLSSSRGHKAVAKLLLEQGADVNVADRNQSTPLYRATTHGHVELAKLLLEQGANVNAANQDGRTPLYWATREGHVEIAKLLLERGANIKAADRHGETPFDRAIIYGHVELVKLLLERGADVNAANRRGETPLYRATIQEHIELVKLLLERGADVNAANQDGRTPLYWATREGHVEIAKLLLERGANIKAADRHGETPFDRAIIYGHVELVKLLLERGADVNAADRYGETPFDRATIYGHVELAKLLLERGADVNAANRRGETPLYRATIQEHIELVKLLLERGADVNAADRYGETPFDRATIYGHVELAKLLLERGADVNAANQDGRTPLYWATREGHVELVKLLLKHGADVNAADQYGGTPLHMAAITEHVELAKLLLEHGAKKGIEG